MKSFLVFLGLAVAGVSASWFKPGLRVKFDIGLRPGTDFFFEVPRTLTEAVIRRWSFTDRPLGPRAPLVLYCPVERHVCGFYDDNGFVAGLQIAVPQDEFTDAVFDWQTQGFTEWAPKTATGEIKKYWAIQQYFVNDEYLQLNPADRLAHYNSKKLLQQDAVWLTGFNGELDKITTLGRDIENSIFTKQACMSWMGRHYYYNMTKSTPCQADTLYPWFPMLNLGEVVASGLIIYGKLPIQPNQRDWFERPARLVVQGIVPQGPECLYKLASNPGVITLHIYYIDEPWNLNCNFS